MGLTSFEISSAMSQFVLDFFVKNSNLYKILINDLYTLTKVKVYKLFFCENEEKKDE